MKVLTFIFFSLPNCTVIVMNKQIKVLNQNKVNDIKDKLDINKGVIAQFFDRLSKTLTKILKRRQDWNPRAAVWELY